MCNKATLVKHHAPHAAGTFAVLLLIQKDGGWTAKDSFGGIGSRHGGAATERWGQKSELSSKSPMLSNIPEFRKSPPDVPSIHECRVAALIVGPFLELPSWELPGRPSWTQGWHAPFDALFAADAVFHSWHSAQPRLFSFNCELFFWRLNPNVMSTLRNPLLPPLQQSFAESLSTMPTQGQLIQNDPQ